MLERVKLGEGGQPSAGEGGQPSGEVREKG